MFNARTIDEVIAAVDADPRVREHKLVHNPEVNMWVVTIRGTEKSGKTQKRSWLTGSAQGASQVEAYRRAFDAFMIEIQKQRAKDEAAGE